MKPKVNLDLSQKVDEMMQHGFSYFLLVNIFD